MNKKVNTGGSRKRQKLPPPPHDQSLISNFFFIVNNPNSQRSVANISVCENTDDDEIVLHKRNEHLIVEEEYIPNEVNLMECYSSGSCSGEVMVTIKSSSSTSSPTPSMPSTSRNSTSMPRNKRVIVEDKEVPNEVKLLEENVHTVTKSHKYTDASF